MSLCMHGWMHVRVYTFVYVCMHARMCVYVCVCVRIQQARAPRSPHEGVAAHVSFTSHWCQSPVHRHLLCQLSPVRRGPSARQPGPRYWEARWLRGAATSLPLGAPVVSHPMSKVNAVYIQTWEREERESVCVCVYVCVCKNNVMEDTRSKFVGRNPSIYRYTRICMYLYTYIRA